MTNNEITTRQALLKLVDIINDLNSFGTQLYSLPDEAYKRRANKIATLTDKACGLLKEARGLLIDELEVGK